MNRQGSWFRGRRWAGQYADTDHVAGQREEERQQWVYAVIEMETEFLVVDPEREYQQHRAAYEATGSEAELRLMLQYVQP